MDYVKSGAADIGWIYTSFFAGQFPLTDVINVPMSGLYHPAQTANVLWSLYEEYPELQEELSDFKILMLYGNPVNFISTKGKPIETVSDLKGLNLRCPTGGVSEVLQAWGANPILMNSNDIYEALEKGNIAGTVHDRHSRPNVVYFFEYLYVCFAPTYIRPNLSMKVGNNYEMQKNDKFIDGLFNGIRTAVWLRCWNKYRHTGCAREHRNAHSGSVGQRDPHQRVRAWSLVWFPAR